MVWTVDNGKKVYVADSSIAFEEFMLRDAARDLADGIQLWLRIRLANEFLPNNLYV